MTACQAGCMPPEQSSSEPFTVHGISQVVFDRSASCSDVVAKATAGTTSARSAAAIAAANGSARPRVRIAAQYRAPR